MERLGNLLKSIDGKGYKAYKEISGKYKIKDLELEILNVQGDPFASPTLFELTISLRRLLDNIELFNNKVRQVAFEDYLLRELFEKIKLENLENEIIIQKPSMEVLRRTAINIKGEFLHIKYYMNLPAKGRNVLGHSALKKINDYALKIEGFLVGFDMKKARKHVILQENIEDLREQITKDKIKVFIGNGSILKKDYILNSPKTLEKEFILKNGEKIKGLCIKEGITVITGYDFQGKSTLLQAISRGIYNHIEGSGLEYLLTNREAVNIFAEKNRVIHGLDMSSFIKEENRARHYDESCASSLISQTANLLEAIEVGTPLLLIDEDTSVVNFLYRDKNLKNYLEGIEYSVPFIEKMKKIYANYNISSIIVTSSIESFVNCANTVILMKNYELIDISNNIVKKEYSNTKDNDFSITRRKVNVEKTLEDFQGKKYKFKTCGTNFISFGKEEIQINSNNYIIDNGQLNFIGEVIKKIFSREELHEKTLREILETYERRFENEGIEEVLDTKNGMLTFARKYEIALVINRFPKKLYIDEVW